MDHIGLTSMKKAYAEELAGNGEISKAEKIMESSETDPVFSGFTIHPEQEPNTSSINKSFRDIAIDIYALNKEIQSSVLSPLRRRRQRESLMLA